MANIPIWAKNVKLHKQVRITDKNFETWNRWGLGKALFKDMGDDGPTLNRDIGYGIHAQVEEGTDNILLTYKSGNKSWSKKPRRSRSRKTRRSRSRKTKRSRSRKTKRSRSK